MSSKAAELWTSLYPKAESAYRWLLDYANKHPRTATFAAGMIAGIAAAIIVKVFI